MTDAARCPGFQGNDTKGEKFSEPNDTKGEKKVLISSPSMAYSMRYA